ncbi:MAG: flagellar basal body P-ring formation chaperone FlgA [Rubrivivax sp.]|nr:flagellar basal body P-ring formation chaperone FlgA [Rubrivivax sp.]
MKLRLSAPRPSRLVNLPAGRWLWVALGLCPALALPAGPPALPSTVLLQALNLSRQAALAVAPPQARVVALPGALDPRLKLAPCDQVQAFLPAGVPAWGRSRVGLRCLKGPVAWQVYLPVTVQVWAPAAVAAAALPMGAQLDSSQMATAEVDWAAASTAPTATSQTLQGRVLARPVAAGQPLRAADLKARQWFAQGDMVRIVAQGLGFAISAEGQALGPGFEGQRVRVRTDAGRVLVGQAVGHNRVEVQL